MQDHINASTLPSVQALSFLGDAVCSLYVRRRLVACGISHAGDLNKMSLAYVTAEAQAEVYARIEPYLSDEERALVRRAANSKHLKHPKSASMKDYRTASGLEALFGMHEYLGNRARNEFLLSLGMRFPSEELRNNTAENGME